jgi:hypothetical protein
MEAARSSLKIWLERRGGTLADYIFPSWVDHSEHLSTRHNARLVDEWVAFTDDAIDAILAVTERYPYFLQQWGFQAWNVAQQSPITKNDINAATPAAIPAEFQFAYKPSSAEFIWHCPAQPFRGTKKPGQTYVPPGFSDFAHVRRDPPVIQIPIEEEVRISWMLAKLESVTAKLSRPKTVRVATVRLP